MTTESKHDNDDLIWLASFDVGKKNFSFYIEETNQSTLKNIKNIPRDKRYHPNGTPTPKMEKILQKIYMTGKTILHINADLTNNCQNGKYLDTETFHNLTDLLDKHSKLLDKCSVFIIEQQMSFRGKYNTMALKVGQHCFSYFAIKFGRFKPVLEFPSFHKTHILGAEKIKTQTKKGKVRYKNIAKPARKKWTIKKSLEILEQRGEEHIFKQLKTVKKKDDLADTLCQLQAFKYLAFVDKSI